MRRLLHRLWPTESRGVAKTESIERTYLRGKEEVQTARFDAGDSKPADDGAALGVTDAPGSRYPTAEEFQKFVTGLYLPDNTAWIPVQDHGAV